MINPFMLSEPFYLWTGPLHILGVPGWFSLLQSFVEITIFNANSVDPDQMPHFVASDLGQHCLPMPPFKARFRCVNQNIFLWRSILFVCVEVLQLSQPNGIMLSAVSLPNHTIYWAGLVL